MAGVGHPLASRTRLGFASLQGVYFSAGRIDALIVCEGQVLRTSQPRRTRFGIAQVRRELGSGPLEAVHLVFAPDTERPLLLGLARLHNASASPLALGYTELWEVDGTGFRGAEGACERQTGEGLRALAEISMAVRARVPKPPPRAGLVLEVRLLIPPRGLRELHFAYAAPGPGESAAELVRAWRGAVPAELARSLRSWRERLGGAAPPVEAYRRCAEAEP